MSFKVRRRMVAAVLGATLAGGSADFTFSSEFSFTSVSNKITPLSAMLPPPPLPFLAAFFGLLLRRTVNGRVEAVQPVVPRTSSPCWKRQPSIRSIFPGVTEMARPTSSPLYPRDRSEF